MYVRVCVCILSVSLSLCLCLCVCLYKKYNNIFYFIKPCQSFLTRTSQPFLTKIELFSQKLFTKTLFIHSKPVSNEGVALDKRLLY